MQVLAYKRLRPVIVLSYYLQNYWNLYLGDNSFLGPLIIGTFKKRVPDLCFVMEPREIKQTNNNFNIFLSCPDNTEQIAKLHLMQDTVEFGGYINIYRLIIT